MASPSTSTATGRKYGWKPDLPDHRDLIYRAPRSLEALPPAVDLRHNCSPVENQGQLGSCTGNAIAGALEYLDRKLGNPIDISRLFIYYQERAMEGTIHQDAGAMIRDGIKACAKLGAPIEKLWPYRVEKFANKPAHEAYLDAARRKIVTYRRVVGRDDVLHCLADGFPVVFGFSVYEQFESDEVARTGIANMPGPDERMLGGHAVLAVGYNIAQQRLLVRNSWGVDWGMAGHFTLPFGYIQSASLSDDFWVVQR